MVGDADWLGCHSSERLANSSGRACLPLAKVVQLRFAFGEGRVQHWQPALLSQSPNVPHVPTWCFDERTNHLGAEAVWETLVNRAWRQN
jgi:hypothetical protein